MEGWRRKSRIRNSSAARGPRWTRSPRRTLYHTLELPGGRTLPGVIGVDALRKRLEAFPLPADLTGRRVLDVGAASGWNSFAVEDRGADVMAVDCVAYEELPVVAEARGSRVAYRIFDVDELTPAAVGQFDYVLFFGVLYHLRHPLLGLERVCALTREAAFVESFVTDHGATPSDAATLEFYEIDELGGQIDNWFGPTVKALAAMCRAAGFARVKLEYVDDRRAGITCYRRWEPPPERPSAEPPWLCSAVNNRTQTSVFHPAKDEYVCLYFRSNRELTRDQLRVEIDGYGVPVLLLAAIGNGEWQANMTLPPGLDPGEHSIRLRTVDSHFSRPFPIEVSNRQGAVPPLKALPDPSLATGPAPQWIAAENCADRTPVFRGYKAEYLCCRFLTDEPELRKEDVLVELDGAAQEILVLSHLGHREWQTNSRLPARLAPGPHAVRLRTASPYTEFRDIRPNRIWTRIRPASRCDCGRPVYPR